MRSLLMYRPGLLTATLAALLAACSSGYQAPIEDRSTTLERSPPIIVSNGQEIPAAPRQSASASTPPPATSSSSNQVGASTTVVRPVTISSGISSTGITRSAQIETTPPPAQSQSTAPSTPVPQPQAQPAAQPQTPPTVPAAGTSTPAADSPAPASTGNADTPRAPTTYEVARGDTLYSIAWNHSIDYRTLALVNNLDEPYTIYPGQRLVISESGISAAAIREMPDIPAAPAGEESLSATGQRPQAAMEGRRTGTVPTRQMDGVTWQWPLDGRILSGSGSARGLELEGRTGDPVYAAADGDVVFAGRGIQGAGNLIILRHSARHLSAYMHNSLMLVVEGDRVHAGDKIAEVGSANGRDLLRFEIRVDGAPTDPQRYLPSR